MKSRVSGRGGVRSAENKRDLWRDQRGMALLITVMTVSLLVAVTIQFFKTTWQQYLVSNNYKVGTQLKTIADSGVNIALAVLQNDVGENKTVSLLHGWAELTTESYEKLFPTGKLQLKIVDLSSRLQINSLVQKTDNNTEADIRQVFLNLLMSGAFSIEDETEARSIVDAMIDWLDEDDQESDLGAESGYYQSLSIPYSCRNGPVRYIEELLLIKGITPGLLFGTGGKKGLADYLTVNGEDGKVNLNTAPLLIIKSFDLLIGDDLLEKLDEYRRNKDNKEVLSSLGWYKEVAGWPGDIVINENLLTNKSSYFQITATGEFDTLSRSVVAVVEHSGENEFNLLEKKME